MPYKPNPEARGVSRKADREGLAREMLGEFFDRATLKESGRLQQEKGSAKLDALQAEVKAETGNAKVKALDKAQQKAAAAS